MRELLAIRARIKKHAPKALLFLYRLIHQGRIKDILSSAHFLMSPIPSVSLSERFEILEQIYAISASVYCEHTQQEMLAFIRTILTIPKEVNGCIVEAGCYKGGSTAKFSLAVDKVNRKLIVFDSFAGLPDNSEAHDKTIFGERPDFSVGKYGGTLPEVRQNVSLYGKADSCQFIEGWFEETMPQFSDSIAAIYLDVDLVSSTKTCLKNLYPRLQPGGLLYSQDAHLPLIIDLLRDERFWRDEVECPMPQIEGLGKRKLVRIRKPLVAINELR